MNATDLDALTSLFPEISVTTLGDLLHYHGSLETAVASLLLEADEALTTEEERAIAEAIALSLVAQSECDERSAAALAVVERALVSWAWRRRLAKLRAMSVNHLSAEVRERVRQRCNEAAWSGFEAKDGRAAAKPRAMAAAAAGRARESSRRLLLAVRAARAARVGFAGGGAATRLLGAPEPEGGEACATEPEGLPRLYREWQPPTLLLPALAPPAASAPLLGSASSSASDAASSLDTSPRDVTDVLIAFDDGRANERRSSQEARYASRVSRAKAANQRRRLLVAGEAVS